MATITATVRYEGDLRCKLTHNFSGTTIYTDAPLDNHGKAQSFSPTDLAATSAAACALTIMGIAAREHGFNIDGARAEVTKIMAANPRRIAEIHIHFFFPPFPYTDAHRRLIEHIALNCPVMVSLNSQMQKIVHLHYAEAGAPLDVP
ncbi:MAG: OsmC family protein [Chitinophagales bacterium]|nr:OsmC family protein [Chitinophagales bacterium]MDW8427646.1 OsmC family protein [Chitinophagales bacterium]